MQTFLYLKKDYNSAIKHYTEVLYKDPLNAPAERNLGECIKRSGKDPDDVKVRLSMADDANAGNYPTAIVEFRLACKIVDNGPNRARLGKVLIKMGKDVEGYAELRDSLRKKPANR